MNHRTTYPGQIALAVDQGLLKITRFGEAVNAGQSEILSEIWGDLSDEQWGTLTIMVTLEYRRRQKLRQEREAVAAP